MSERRVATRAGGRYTTNYANTFIAAAPDSPATVGLIPPERAGKATVAGMTYAMIAAHPYEYTSDDVIFTVWADRRGIAEADRPAARAEFFSKGQACLRASDLCKKFGWGIHHDAGSRIALVPVESADYERLVHDDEIAHTQAMRSKR